MSSHAPDKSTRQFNRVPTATCRLQFNRDFSFQHAMGIADYLRALGISDVYASPLFQAGPDSKHGYDICCFSKINADLGTEADFERFTATLHEHGLGLLLDMVPNHMGALLSNSWWLDVLAKGRDSAYAKYFDINWESETPSLQGKVLLPILEDDYAQVLANGKLKLGFESGEFFIDYYDHKLPIATQTLSPEAHEDPASTLSDFNCQPGDARTFDRLDALIQRQHYRLAHWKTASQEINYRRFFDIAELIALRMESPEVFAATHQRVLSWLASGKITGLRIDHPDGLWNPRHYFERLQTQASQRAHPDTAPVFSLSSPEGGEGRGEEVSVFPVQIPSPQPSPRLGGERESGAVAGCAPSQPGKRLYLVVEKILSGDETLADDWPIAGTTGYDFLNRVNGLFINQANEKALDQIYREFTGNQLDFKSLVYQSKKRILEASFMGELNALTRQLHSLAVKTTFAAEFVFDHLKQALKELIAAFPVYRTYLREDSCAPTIQERAAIEKAIAEAQSRTPAFHSELKFLKQVLTLEVPSASGSEFAALTREFVMKFQQLTGPVMAKGFEDTALYNYNRLISLNEVGGDPTRFGVSLEEFHNANRVIMTDWPHTLLATATHDTKRGEDARARINVLSEIPNEWRTTVVRWRELNADQKVTIENQPAPTANDEYLLYQSLVGALPLVSGQFDCLSAFRERTLAFLLKAVREAKANTSWTEQNPAYESAVKGFVERILTDTVSNKFLEELFTFSRRVSFFGKFNSLSQTVLKITSPGVPDFYQGTELWDYSFVDPDNRRAVDFDLRKRLLKKLKKNWFMRTRVRHKRSSNG